MALADSILQDEKPIQTIPLGPNTRVEHTYEESQVQGSWKITSDGPSGQEVSSLPPFRPRLIWCVSVCVLLLIMPLFQEFFVFADSPEEKETILEGLQMSIS